MKLLFYSLLIALEAVACNYGKAEKPQLPSDIVSISKTDTSKLINFPGTTIYIELPKGFVWNETAMGFYKDEVGSIIKYDEFKTMRYAANMPVEESMGTLINRQTITVSRYEGEIKTYQDGSTAIKLVLSIGDSTFMKFIEATYFTKQEQSGKEVLAALKTIQLK